MEIVRRSGELDRLDLGWWQAYSGGLEYLDRFKPNAKRSLELSGDRSGHKE